MQEPLDIYYMTQPSTTSPKIEKVRKLVKLSAIMANTAQILDAYDQAKSMEEYRALHQASGACKAVSELSKKQLEQFLATIR